MDYRPGVSAVHSLQCLSDRLMLLLYTVTLSLCLLLKLNDNDDDDCFYEHINILTYLPAYLMSTSGCADIFLGAEVHVHRG